jgi:hypothetical protein
MPSRAKTARKYLSEKPKRLLKASQRRSLFLCLLSFCIKNELATFLITIPSTFSIKDLFAVNCQSPTSRIARAHGSCCLNPDPTFQPNEQTSSEPYLFLNLFVFQLISESSCCYLPILSRLDLRPLIQAPLSSSSPPCINKYSN